MLGLIGDFMAKKVCDVKCIYDFFAKGRDMRRGDIQRKIGKNFRDFRQQPCTVQPLQLDQGEAIGKAVVDTDPGRDLEGFGFSPSLRPVSNHFRKIFTTGQHIFNHSADPLGATQFIVVRCEFPAEHDRIQCPAVAGCKDLGIDNIGPGCRAGTGNN